MKKDYLSVIPVLLIVALIVGVCACNQSETDEIGVSETTVEVEVSGSQGAEFVPADTSSTELIPAPATVLPETSDAANTEAPASSTGSETNQALPTAGGTEATKPTRAPATSEPTKTPNPTKDPTVRPTKTPAAPTKEAPTKTPTATPKPTKAPTPTSAPYSWVAPTKAPSPTPKPTSTPKPTATPTPKPTSSAGEWQDDKIDDVIKKLNEQRKEAVITGRFATWYVPLKANSTLLSQAKKECLNYSDCEDLKATISGNASASKIASKLSRLVDWNNHAKCQYVNLGLAIYYKDGKTYVVAIYVKGPSGTGIEVNLPTPTPKPTKTPTPTPKPTNTPTPKPTKTPTPTPKPADPDPDDSSGD